MDDKELITSLQEEMKQLKEKITEIETQRNADNIIITNQDNVIKDLKEKHTKYLEKLTNFENNNHDSEEDDGLSIVERGKKLREEIRNGK